MLAIAQGFGILLQTAVALEEAQRATLTPIISHTSPVLSRQALPPTSQGPRPSPAGSSCTAASADGSHLEEPRASCSHPLSP